LREHLGLLDDREYLSSDMKVDPLAAIMQLSLDGIIEKNLVLLTLIDLGLDNLQGSYPVLS